MKTAFLLLLIVPFLSVAARHPVHYYTIQDNTPLTSEGNGEPGDNSPAGNEGDGSAYHAGSDENGDDAGSGDNSAGNNEENGANGQTEGDGQNGLPTIYKEMSFKQLLQSTADASR